jgi:hypothetical protein
LNEFADQHEPLTEQDRIFARQAIQDDQPFGHSKLRLYGAFSGGTQ